MSLFLGNIRVFSSEGPVCISNLLSNGSQKRRIDRKLNERRKKKEGREKGIEGRKS